MKRSCVKQLLFVLSVLSYHFRHIIERNYYSGVIDMHIRADSRCEQLAQYIIDTQSTVRDAAAKFGISKSTVHKDVTERLELKNRALFELVREVLDKNKSERHLRGGEATKNKYMLKHMKKGSLSKSELKW